MLNKIAGYFTGKLLSNGSISEDEQELYAYGLFMLISTAAYLILACVLGLILGCVIQSIIFFVAFQFIRRYAGGYHASTEIRCNILSTFSISVCILLIKLSNVYNYEAVLFICAVVSAILIFFFTPLDTPEKPLSEKEYKYFRKISHLILLIIFVLIVISYMLNFFHVFLAPCGLSLILECILLMSGKIKRILQNKNVC